MATSRMLIDERPIMFLPKLAKALGSCERAIVLQQIHWLSNQPHSGKDIDGEHWVWGTYEEWCRDYFMMWTPRTLKMHIQNLEKKEVLISAQLRAHEHDQTKYYRINYGHELLTDTGMGHDHVPSNEHNDVPSIEHDAIASKGQDHVPSSITESSSKREEGEEAPLPSGESALFVDGEKVTDKQAMYAAICEACGWDRKVLTDREQVETAELVKTLMVAKYSSSDIGRYMTEVWFIDFRWEKNKQRPKLVDIRKGIGQLRSAMPETAPRRQSGSKGERNLSTVDEYYRRKALLEQESEQGK